MPLFDQILGAINSPNQQGNANQLGSILGAVQQLSGSQGMDASQTQVMMSMVGGYVRSALQEKRATGGQSQVESIIQQFAGTQPNPAAVQTLFAPAQQQQISAAIAQRTGLNPTMVQSLLTMAVPLVLNLLSTGNTNANAEPSTAQSNSVLNAFLDADGDGDVDMADTLSMAGRFLTQPR